MAIKDREPIIIEDDLYFYNLSVVDNETSNPVIGATVTLTDIGSKTTSSSGKVIFRSDKPNAQYTITKSGYITKTGTIVGKQTSTYTTIKINPVTFSSYFAIKVVDSSNAPIPSAHVDLYTTATTTQVYDAGETESNGIFLYGTNGDITKFYVRVSKNGYAQSSAEVYKDPSRAGALANPVNVRLQTSTNADYYYVVAVKDNGGRPVKNAEVGFYASVSYSTPYVVETLPVSSTKAKNNIEYKVREIVSQKSGKPMDIVKLTDRFSSYNYGFTGFKNEFQTEFKTEIPTTVEYELSARGTLNSFVDWVINNATSYQVKVSIYTTDANGLICIPAKTRTQNIYAKGLDLPSTYTWTSDNKGVLTPGLSQTSPSKTLIAHSYSGSSAYYHSIKVEDVVTMLPIAGANVIYTYNGTKRFEAVTNNDGIVRYTDSYQNLDVTIVKENFNECENIPSDGKYEETYMLIKLQPENSIMVVDEYDNPVEGIKLKIVYYGDNDIAIQYGLFRTNANGYIQTLDSRCYGNNYYAIVKNYIPKDEQPLKTRIGKGLTKIKLPEGTTDSEYVEESQFLRFNEMTVNAIKNNIDKGNREILNIDKGESKKVEYNAPDYMINIVDPDSIETYDIFTSTPVIMSDNNKSVIGSMDTTLNPDLNELKVRIVNRYSGYYNPIFKDILFYNNFINCPYSNTEFDNRYEDHYGKFGVINNMWFHKVNDNPDIDIINTLTPYYPLIGQYAIDHRDYNIFESNWDMNYYTKQLDVNHSEPCQNISSMQNGICMFGSKYLNVPKKIEIYGLTLGDDPEWNGEWNDDWITNPDGCPGEVMFKEVNNNSVDFYFFFKKRILRYFYDKLKDVFEEFISDDYSFGKQGVEDDIQEYVLRNVLKLYKLEKIRMFVRRRKEAKHNSRIEDDYTTYLEFDKTYPPESVNEVNRFIDLQDGHFKYVEYFRQHGFVEVNNVTLSKINRDSFDRKLVYNLRNGMREEFAFGFVLKKI
jgi:hypothetical protein